jgi:hypothetical protein
VTAAERTARLLLRVTRGAAGTTLSPVDGRRGMTRVVS